MVIWHHVRGEMKSTESAVYTLNLTFNEVTAEQQGVRQFWHVFTKLLLSKISFWGYFWGMIDCVAHGFCALFAGAHFKESAAHQYGSRWHLEPCVLPYGPRCPDHDCQQLWPIPQQVGFIQMFLYYIAIGDALIGVTWRGPSLWFSSSADLYPVWFLCLALVRAPRVTQAVKSEQDSFYFLL